jgi:hypothetical protein
MITAIEATQISEGTLGSTRAMATRDRIDLAIRGAAYARQNMTSLSVPAEVAAEMEESLKVAGYAVRWASKGTPYCILHITW